MLKVVYATEDSEYFKKIVDALNMEDLKFRVNESKFNEKIYYEILSNKEEASDIEDIIFNLDK